MKSFERTLARFAAAHLLVIMLFAAAFRLYLWSLHPGAEGLSIFYGLAVGEIFDLAVAVYSFLLPLWITLALPAGFWRRVSARKYFAAILGLEVFIFSFVAVGEFFFYDEFKDRFNFIAVDYLVYTHEVLQNIWESYPVVSVVTALAFIAGGVGYGLARFVIPEVKVLHPVSAPKRFAMAWLHLAFFGLLLLFVREQQVLAQANYTQELLAKNGLHALFAAYRNNEISFDRFYTTTSSERAVAYVHQLLEGPRPARDGVEERDSIVRNMVEEGPMLRKNVVLVLMESLSAKFMKAYGNLNDLTPNLDRLAREGLFFDRIYATGTRTVRGLEAVVLSIPPTPGQSIVRRPAGIGLFNIGSVFRDGGYDTRFIYGGRALFDNMGEFFSGNGFQVLDQSSFPSSEITFSNAWGVADEDLFDQVIKASDESLARGRNFFHVVLNTSNHRPYTYPEGKVPLPPGKRDGAVQYSDYAIGQLIEKSRGKPWFKDTVFVFVADHNAAVAGRAKIDPNDYLVPLIFYAPGWIAPKVVHSMGSQIDIAPTLLEMLNASYQSRFFGLELQDDNPSRAFLGTYQNVGYLDEDSLTVLSPNHRAERWAWDGKNLTFLEQKNWSSLPAEGVEPYLPAVAYYKTASDWFGKRLLEDRRRFGEHINRRN